MKKKIYIKPLTESENCFTTLVYMAGDNSIPYGGEDGPGIAEGKERQGQDALEKNEDRTWGNLW